MPDPSTPERDLSQRSLSQGSLSQRATSQRANSKEAPEALPADYYLDNFKFLLNHVQQQYDDILSEEERDFAQGFRALSADAQRLYVRLAGRKRPLFRTDKLKYPEISDIDAAGNALVHARYADHGEDAGVEEWLALLTKDELLQLDVGIALERTARRDALVEQLCAAIDSGSIMATVMEQCHFNVLRPLKLETLRTWKLLFFGNLNQDFTEFVLNDLGITPFERYAIHPEVRFFDNRAILDETLDLYRLAEVAEEVIESCDVLAMHQFLAELPEADELASGRLQRRRDRLANRVARQLEREEALPEALAAYQRCRAAPSRERRARIHDRRAETDAAIDLCWAIIESPEDEAEYEFAVRFLKRLYNKTSRTLTTELPDITGDNFRCKDITLPFDPSIKVEHLATDWFRDNAHDAWYVENGLLPGLFGLVFWDVIFHPIPGAFHHPFQRGPADLFTADFRAARRRLIDNRLEEIQDKEILRRYVASRYIDKQGLANHFVDWRVLDESLLNKTLDEMPLDHLMSVFQRLLRDVRNNRSGFPDLVVFPAGGGYRLVEVKGPGDTLQNNQKRWLRHFREVGIPGEVVRVSWQ